GVLLTWHKNEGDAVAVDDLLAEVETDKATMEFRAFDKGVLLKQLVPAGTNVKLGQAVAILGDKGEDVSELVAKAGGAPAAPAAPAAPDTKQTLEAEANEPEAKGPEEREPKDKRAPETMRPAAQQAAPAPRPKPRAPVDKGSVLDRTQRDVAAQSPDEVGTGRVLASPYVRKVARERGIDLSAAHGSGEHGRIVPADLESIGQSNGSAQPAASTSTQLARAPQASLASPAAAALAQPEARPLSPMRKTIARRLTESKQTVPHFYLTIDVDASAVMELRETINAQLAEGVKKKSGPGEDAPKPEKISINDLVIKAVAGALVRVPECNAQFTPEALLIHRRVDISVAVAIPDGLVTPVVRNADQKSVVAIAREVRDLAARARAKKLKPEEMSDGTFSISNLGMFGIDAFSAVINPPEGAILAIGQARDEAVVKDGNVVAGKKMTMTLSCDHRVIDGAVGAAFLAELRALLEHPMRILTG
ncbi:MAG TPA: dihydrolipoamide acetyltransferase family protein, partial [Labilithrix sp.]|nr:dihydrolipoamide acetyltransferase family protein [Labilithrix sp.]